MSKKTSLDDSVIDRMVQEQLKLFAEHRKIFVEVSDSGRVYLTVHVVDSVNDGLWDRILRLFHLMNIELAVQYTHSADGHGLEAIAEGMSHYQIAILQKFVDCNCVIC